MNPEGFGPDPRELGIKPESEAVVEKPTMLAERARKAIGTLFRIEASGLDNIDRIPSGRPVIFLATHRTNYDVGIAIAALAEKVPRLKVAESSTHESFKQNAGGYLMRRASGAQDSFSVDYTGGEGDGDAKFNPKNFEPM